MDDRDLLRSAQLWLQDYQSGEQGLTLAAILLFGNDSTILSILPHHRTDAILRRDNTDRYDDRDDIRTNLLDSHDRLMAFGEKHLMDPFYQEGEQRISLRSHILREIVGNLLIHREYSQAFPAKLVIEQDRLYTENSNRPHGHGPINPLSFTPYPKNPVIARIFKEIGWADELGSGVRKLFKYSKAYGGHDPELVEDDVFRLSLSLPKSDSTASVKASVKASAKASVKTPVKIVELMRVDKTISAASIAQAIGLSLRAVEMQISALKKEGRIKRIGAARGGHWEILK